MKIGGKKNFKENIVIILERNEWVEMNRKETEELTTEKRWCYSHFYSWEKRGQEKLFGGKAIEKLKPNPKLMLMLMPMVK